MREADFLFAFLLNIFYLYRRNETNPVHHLSVCKLPADGGVQFAPCGEGMDRAG